MARGTLLKRLEKAEESAKALSPIQLSPYDEDWYRSLKLASADFDSMTVVSAVVFLGVIGVKHKCRAATEEEFQQVMLESPTYEPTGFAFGQQRFNELLVEVMEA